MRAGSTNGHGITANDLAVALAKLSRACKTPSRVNLHIAVVSGARIHVQCNTSAYGLVLG